MMSGCFDDIDRENKKTAGLLQIFVIRSMVICT